MCTFLSVFADQQRPVESLLFHGYGQRLDHTSFFARGLEFEPKACTAVAHTLPFERASNSAKFCVAHWVVSTAVFLHLLSGASPSGIFSSLLCLSATSDSRVVGSHSQNPREPVCKCAVGGSISLIFVFLLINGLAGSRRFT